MNFLFIILAIYFINLFFGLKLLFQNNINFSNMIYTLLLIIIFPILTPIIYLTVFFDDKIRTKLMKKRNIDKSLIKDINAVSIYKNNDTFIFNDGKLLFEDIFNEIENAKEYIHISFFTFNTDAIGKKMISKLEEKLKANVDVKILYDPLGSYKMKKKYFKNYIKLGGELISFMPLFKSLFLNINYRNHRKILIIDNKISYIGSFNIGDKYLSRDKKLGLWVDSQLKIIGDATSQIEKRFLTDYSYCLNKNIDIVKYLKKNQFQGKKNIQIISSGTDVNDINYIENKFMENIYNAKKYIYIQTPYLILNDAMIRALKYASIKNVAIKIMLPNKKDHPFVLDATKSYAKSLIDNNIEIYLFNKEAFLHSKVFICDDEFLSVGTSNFDLRSFKYNLEINPFIYDKDLAILYKNIFIKEINNCTLFTKDMIKKESTFKKIKEDLCKLLSSYL